MKTCLRFFLTMILLLTLILTGCQSAQEQATAEQDASVPTENTVENVPEITDKEINADEDTIIPVLSKEGANCKSDYLEVCELLYDKYIYLEDQLGVDRDTFYSEAKAYADQLNWTGEKVQFVQEIRKLMSQFKDGHIGWFLPSEYRISKSVTLGFVPTMTTEHKVIISKVLPIASDKLTPNDEILEWKGKPVYDEVLKIATLSPSSTEIASLEKATRNLAIDFSFMPLRDQYDPVTLKVKHEDGSEENVILSWKACSGYMTYGEKCEQPTVFLTPSMVPSTEEIPVDAEFFHPSLLYYTRTIGNQVVGVLHPRDFYQWSQEDLDQTMKALLDQNPAVLFVDLKDTAGGAFDQVIFLAHALDITKPFRYSCETINASTGEREIENADFAFIEDEIHLNHIWKGKVIFKLNPIIQSGGDFFTRWMQLNNENNRFVFIGTPTGAAGAGTDSFELGHSKIEINIPCRAYTIAEDDAPIEGHSVMPDFITDMSVEAFLKSDRFDEFVQDSL